MVTGDPSTRMCYGLAQESPNFLNKETVYCPSDFSGVGLWLIGEENAPVPMVARWSKKMI